MIYASHCARSAAIGGRERAVRVYTRIADMSYGGSGAHGHATRDADALRGWLCAPSAARRGVLVQFEELKAEVRPPGPLAHASALTRDTRLRPNYSTYIRPVPSEQV